MHPVIACLASQSSDWLGALWASLSGVRSNMTFVRLNVIGCCWGEMFNCPVSTCWLIDCALTHHWAKEALHIIPKIHHSTETLAKSESLQYSTNFPDLMHN